MRTISLTLSKDVLNTSRRCAASLHLSMATYIHQAVERMNRETLALLRARRLAEASKKVRKESMRVNRELAAIEQVSLPQVCLVYSVCQVYLVGFV